MSSNNTDSTNNTHITPAPQGAVSIQSGDIELQTGSISLIADHTVIGVPTIVPYRASQRDSADTLDNFFARPRAIYTFNWSTASAPVTFDPWLLYLASPTVLKKMSTFYGFRGTLHVAVVLSTQPQLYGGLRIHYMPFHGMSTGGSSRSPALNIVYPPQHVFINAANPSGCEFVCPFFFDMPWLDPNLNGAGTETRGTMAIVPVATIARADGVAPGTIDVQFYAWLTEVEFTGATYVYQSEYSSTPISGPATTVANVASMLTSYPIIGPFAKATEIGARAVAGIAKLFGFSRPVDIRDHAVVLPRSVGRLAVTSGLDPVDKLSTDPKCELSIAPQTVGLPGTEINLITDMAKNESFLCSISWATTDATNAFLKEWMVTPYLFSEGANGSISHLGYAALPFGMWTGSIIYRFRIFSSPFQRGRLFIFFDPIFGTYYASLMSGQNPDTLAQTNHFCVLDIATDTDVDFVVGHAQLRAWNRTMPIATTANVPSALNADCINGMMAVFVDAPLLSPAAATVQIHVTVRAGDDFMVASPNVEIMNDYIYQSNLVVTENVGATKKAAKTCVLCASRVDSAALSASYLGENIASARSLSKRYSLIGTCGLPATAAPVSVNYRVTRWQINMSPHLNWYLGSFCNTSTGPSDYMVMPSFMRWWASCHAGYRGSFRYKIVHNIPPTQRCQVIISREGPTQVRLDKTLVPTVVLDVQQPNSTVAIALNMLYDTAQGALVMDAHQAGGIEFEIPWQNHTLFNSLGSYAAPGITQHIPFFNITFVGRNWDMANFNFQLYEAAGEDFTPFYYTGPPTAIADNNNNSYPGWVASNR